MGMLGAKGGPRPVTLFQPQAQQAGAAATAPNNQPAFASPIATAGSASAKGKTSTRQGKAIGQSKAVGQSSAVLKQGQAAGLAVHAVPLSRAEPSGQADVVQANEATQEAASSEDVLTTYSSFGRDQPSSYDTVAAAQPQHFPESADDPFSTVHMSAQDQSNLGQAFGDPADAGLALETFDDMTELQL